MSPLCRHTLAHPTIDRLECGEPQRNPFAPVGQDRRVGPNPPRSGKISGGTHRSEFPWASIRAECAAETARSPINPSTAAPSSPLEVGAPEVDTSRRLPPFDLSGLLAGAFVVGVIALGCALRFWELGRAPINADQATVGLMAHEILRGHFSTFFWGQHYGGGEPYLVAILFALFGQSTFTLGLAPAVLDACAALLVWRIGRRLFSPQVGVGAGLLFWIWPAAYVELSTVEYGFRWLALLSGLVALFEALRIADRDRSRRRGSMAVFDWFGLGLAIGVGWWCSPEILYFALPSIGLVAIDHFRHRVRLPASGVLVMVVSAALGAMPWLTYNVGRGFRSLHERRHSLSVFEDRLRSLGTHSLPIALGLRLQRSGTWVISTSAGRALFALFLIGLGGVVLLLVRQRRAFVLVGFCAFAPLGFAIAPTVAWIDGRYALYFAPVIALLVIEGCTEVTRILRGWLIRVDRRDRGGVSGSRPRRALELSSVVVLVVALGFTLGALGHTTPDQPNRLVASQRTWTTWQADPDSWLDPLIATLRSERVYDVYAGYWLGNVLAFTSHETITTTDTPFIRYRPYTVAVESSPRTAWIFVNPARRAALVAETSQSLLDPGCIRSKRGCLALPIFEKFLENTHDPFRVVADQEFFVVLPMRAVEPQSLLTLVPKWH